MYPERRWQPSGSTKRRRRGRTGLRVERGDVRCSESISMARSTRRGVVRRRGFAATRSHRTYSRRSADTPTGVERTVRCFAFIALANVVGRLRRREPRRRSRIVDRDRVAGLRRPAGRAVLTVAAARRPGRAYAATVVRSRCGRPTVAMRTGRAPAAARARRTTRARHLERRRRLPVEPNLRGEPLRRIETATVVVHDLGRTAAGSGRSPACTLGGASANMG